MGSVALWASVSVIRGMAGYSRGVLVIDWRLLVVLLGGARLSLRIWRGLWPARRSGARAVRVIGAGAAGERGGGEGELGRRVECVRKVCRPAEV